MCSSDLVNSLPVAAAGTTLAQLWGPCSRRTLWPGADILSPLLASCPPTLCSITLCIEDCQNVSIAAAEGCCCARHDSPGTCLFVFARSPPCSAPGWAPLLASTLCVSPGQLSHCCHLFSGPGLQWGARVVSASLGGTGAGLAMYQALARLRDAGILFVASAGNGGCTAPRGSTGAGAGIGAGAGNAAAPVAALLLARTGSSSALLLARAGCFAPSTRVLVAPMQCLWSHPTAACRRPGPGCSICS